MRLSHILWNFGGLAVPLCVAVTTVPLLIENLGDERFGLLALAWGLIGYAGAMDLGLGRALTQMVSRLRGEQNLTDIPDVLMTTGRITLVSGVIGGALIALATLGGAGSWVNAETTPLYEIEGAMFLLVIALPAQAMSATYRGLNEAYLNFKGISLLRAGLGVVNFVGPYMISLFTIDLPWLVAPLVVSRLLALIIYRKLALRCIRGGLAIQTSGCYSRFIARNLFTFGGWVTVSSIVSPILVQADRFVVSATISAAAVSVYVLPYEVVVQSLVMVGAISSVMFPGLSKLLHEKPNEWRSYFSRWLMRVTLLMATVCTMLALFLPILLPLWLQDSLHSESIVIGQILCLGVFANAVGSMFFSLLHAKARADITAKLHLIELPIFLIVLVFMVEKTGIVGAAWAWSGRMVFDTVLLALTSRFSNA